MKRQPPMASRTASMTVGAVCPTNWPLRASALRSTKTSRGRMPWAYRYLPMSRATVVLPVPGFPVSWRFRLVCSTLGSPPLSTKATVLAISWKNSLTLPMPVSRSTSARTRARSSGSPSVGRSSIPKSAAVNLVTSSLTCWMLPVLRCRASVGAGAGAALGVDPSGIEKACGYFDTIRMICRSSALSVRLTDRPAFCWAMSRQQKFSMCVASFSLRPGSNSRWCFRRATLSQIQASSSGV
mmetsp:Transcript_48034/g.135713  ORF Transcript_48034/g.135713 Transcript_48034/m.135713 type:complete len:240 (-) Transcript_48034:886-1605(-)